MKKILFLLLLFCSVNVFAQTDSLIAISDIHFQPFLQGGTYKDDCDSGLFLSAIRSIKKTNANPKYIIITGDFLCHKALDSAEKNNVIHFISATLKSSFKHSIILPALGNNDSYAGDYKMEENDPFYKMFYSSFRGEGNIIDNAFYNRCNSGGYYAYRSEADPSLTIVVLNTTLFSTRAETGDGAAADNELVWLDSVLGKCAAEKQHVWLMYHIPPGADGYKALKTGVNSNMWRNEYCSKFLDEIDHYHSIIKAQFAGHTHNDDFRMIYDGGVPVSYIHIAPSLTPIHGNNPAYQQVCFDEQTDEITDYETFYSPDADKWEHALFEKEYDFSSAYDMKVSLQNLVEMRGNDYKSILLFKKYYVVEGNNQVQPDDANWVKFFEFTRLGK